MKRLLNTLYVTNPDAVVRKRDDALSVYVGEKRMMSVPFHILDGMVLFGHVGCTMSVLSACAERDVHVVLLDERGRFKARVEGAVSGNVLLRKEQYRRAADDSETLALAKRFVIGKVRNTAAIVRHHIRDHPESAANLMTVVNACDAVPRKVSLCDSLEELRGIEGNAAHAYFSSFSHLLRCAEATEFDGRSRRPPRDPVNAALSFFYTLLARDLVAACEAVGLDPQMGFLHACRPGRASLALDLMEELRAPVVDRFVLSLFNRKQLTKSSFNVNTSGGVFFKDSALKHVLAAWQKKKQEQFVHPFIKEKMPIGLIPFVQAQLLARFFRGDLDDYPACLWR